MYSIEILLKNSPMPLSIQRKTAETAAAVYGEVISAMQTGGNDRLLEFTCERQSDKKIAFFVSQVVGVQTYEKSGTPAAGKAAGFAAILDRE
jgi:hypothetical protein